MLRSVVVIVWLATAAIAAHAESAFEDLARRAEDAIGKDPEQAASLYQRALDIRPKWAEGWLYLGATLLQLHRFTESRDALQRGAELAPNRGSAWAYLGLAEYELGDYGRARINLLKGESMGLADRPEFFAAVHYHAALIALRSGDHAAALEQLRPLARDAKPAREVLLALGISSLFLERLPDDIPPNDLPEVMIAGRAANAMLGERYEEAGQLFTQLTHDFDARPGIHYMYGVYLIERDPDAAANQFRREIEVSPSHIAARVQLALLLMQKGDFGAAEKLAREAVQLHSDDALSQVILGRTLLGQGAVSEAIAALEKGERLAPQVARTHFYLQQAYQRAGRTADAQREKEAFSRLRAQQEPVTVASPNETR